MRILFTGASSFTGYWFVRALAAAGHDVVATFRGPPESYRGVRAKRVGALLPVCRPLVCAFGDDRFIAAASAGPWDLLCHHAADVTDYKSPQFNAVAALANNTRNLPSVLSALHGAGCRRIVLTGSVFEPDEGTGDLPLQAFSSYGQSKALTAHAFAAEAQHHGMALGKFVIPNPFGPLEEAKFTTYLAQSWLSGQTPLVSTPDYVRDNIHASLLAAAYRQFVEQSATASMQRFNPSGYAESQRAFAERLAAAMRPRLGLPCPLEFKVQTQFDEPRVRINTDRLDTQALGWQEAQAWDDLAAYYRTLADVS